MTGRNPKSIQPEDEPAPDALAAIQNPKAIMPPEIESENASSMMTSPRAYAYCASCQLLSAREVLTRTA
jgi:hypothetical protein